ncbi:MAG: RNA methyltransferase [Betaproteobacteria bacterium]|jgi:TrmH family RNA methyltransferase|nr:RNA methyltransferase [Betaproteobacteria bacterium]
MNLITSRDNPLVKELRRLSQDSTAYRKTGRVWLEGDHLCRALLKRGLVPEQAIFAQSALENATTQLTQAAPRNTVLPDALFSEISGLESASKMGFVWTIPSSTETHSTSSIQQGVPTVFLDRIQDAGNVGSILRSASAFGFKQVLARKGTAALWSPKVLRAAMGAHFGLHLVEGVEPEQLADLRIGWLSTSSHQGLFLHALGAKNPLPNPCGWIFGHEGQGVSHEVAQLASTTVQIAQPGGEESLNVASAAAICMHASATVGQA